MISRARQVPSSESELAVASEVKVQEMLMTGELVLILTVPLPENFPCNERKKLASSAWAPVTAIRQATNDAAINLIKTSLSRSRVGFPGGKSKHGVENE